MLANTFYLASSKSEQKQNNILLAQKTPIDRVRSWFQENRKNGQFDFKQSNLHQLIDIFRQSKPNDMRIEETLPYDYRKQLSLKPQSAIELAQLQQRRLINAKIRTKINHKKIINLQRKHAV